MGSSWNGRKGLRTRLPEGQRGPWGLARDLANRTERPLAEWSEYGFREIEFWLHHSQAVSY